MRLEIVGQTIQTTFSGSSDGDQVVTAIGARNGKWGSIKIEKQQRVVSG